MGVWIETNLDISAQSKSAVTPCMGVWIETRGTVITNVSRESHPVWVCGLKPLQLFVIGLFVGVTPCMGVWIETFYVSYSLRFKRSHPVWVCGLKQPQIVKH